MSNAVAKATVKVRLIGTAPSSEAFALRDFLQRSVVEFDWIEFGADDRTDRELRLDDAEIQRLPIVQRCGVSSEDCVACRLPWLSAQHMAQFGTVDRRMS